ncbi:unnamed protein product [Clavelina lepadiformis]|uniref:Uncharacterized protein n=1 Tax=Clavelina lepadiformis TaxID=159417 RepID=A0ABP0GIY1_CLALP
MQLTLFLSLQKIVYFPVSTLKTSFSIYSNYIFLNTAVECVTLNYNDDTGNHTLKQQTAKLSKICDYSASNNMIICKLCHGVAPNSDFGKGKSQIKRQNHENKKLFEVNV